MHARGATTAASPARAPSVTLAASDAPPPPPVRWLGLLGEYGDGAAWRIVAEHEGKLRLVDTALRVTPITERAASEFVTDSGGIPVRFTRDATGRASAMQLGDARLTRNDIEPRPGTDQLRVTPVRSVDSVRAEALAASPPAEAGPFVSNDLVELVRLDPSIKLEIRYATTNNFLGTRFYDEARAFLQRPAAEAVVRAHRALRQQGYGLLIHDGYRPWYVTKMFWDATPLDRRWLVADPVAGLAAQPRVRGRSHALRSRDRTSRRDAEHLRRDHRPRVRRVSRRNVAPALAPRAAPARDGGRRLRRERH